MKITELQTGQGSVNIELTIKSLEEPKTIDKYGKQLKLANAIATDGTDEIKITLWNDDVDKVKVGSIIKIENGYVNEFQGEKQLTAGKFGKLEVVNGESSSDDSQSSESENSEEPQEVEDVEDY
jgi:replication factor A1